MDRRFAQLSASKKSKWIAVRRTPRSIPMPVRRAKTIALRLLAFLLRI